MKQNTTAGAPAPARLPRREVDPLPRGASSAITGYQCNQMGLASARVPTLSWASCSQRRGGIGAVPPTIHPPTSPVSPGCNQHHLTPVRVFGHSQGGGAIRHHPPPFLPSHVGASRRPYCPWSIWRAAGTPAVPPAARKILLPSTPVVRAPPSCWSGALSPWFLP